MSKTVIKKWLYLSLDTEEEGDVYEAGGVLQRFAQDFLEGNV
ncbi:hypothetical protein [Acinetobacter sp. ANC 5378]|nr:hypothetical protein [Acinetobacter sp. ANC 5378]